VGAELGLIANRKHWEYAAEVSCPLQLCFSQSGGIHGDQAREKKEV
jgi:hypothetical protein